MENERADAGKQEQHDRVHLLELHDLWSFRPRPALYLHPGTEW